MKKNKKNIIFLMIKIVLLIVIIFVSYKYIIGLYIVRNNDYKCINVNPSDLLIFYKLNDKYYNNDIVFYNNRIYRVIGTNGQVISKVRNKVLIDNISYFDDVSYEYKYPYVIKENELFLISNNHDSRSLGCINKDKIKGKLIFRMQIRDF